MSISVRDLLHPELRGIIDAFALPPLDNDVVSLLRTPEFFTALAGPSELSGAVEVTERTVPGDPTVPVRVHRAKQGPDLQPAIVAIHGGGYLMGNAAMYDQSFDQWCTVLGAVGVAVEYRLAPETPYPGPLDDCYAALCWTHEHAADLGVDPDRIGIGGISAGGGLAAGLALLARDRGEVSVAFQLLDGPMLDDRSHTPSMQAEDLFVWPRASNEFGWCAYLGDLYGRDDIPPYAAPARATDLAGLPPAFVSVGAIDGFRDEDVDFAMRLNQAGVPCELHVYPGVPHGYQMARDASVVRQATRHIDEWLAAQLSNGHVMKDGL